MAKKTSGAKSAMRRWNESQLSTITHWAVFIAVGLYFANSLVMNIAYESDGVILLAEHASATASYMEE